MSQYTVTPDDLSFTLEPSYAALRNHHHNNDDEDTPAEDHLAALRYTDADMPPGEYRVTRSEYGRDAIDIKRFQDNHLQDRYRFIVVDDEKREVTYDGDISEVPQHIHYLLLETGAYCIEWRDDEFLNFTDYLFTYSSVFNEFDKHDDGFLHHFIHSPNIQDWFADVGDGILTTDLLYNRLGDVSGFDKDEYVNHILDTYEPFGDALDPVVAAVDAPAFATKWVHANNACEQFYTAFTESGTGAFVTPTHTPTSRLQILDGVAQEHTPSSSQYVSMSDRYTTRTHRVTVNNTEYLQVVVLTADNVFFDTFHITGDDTCVAEPGENAVPHIFCAAVVREQGYTIENVPHPTSDSITDMLEHGVDLLQYVLQNHDDSPVVEAYNADGVRNMMREYVYVSKPRAELSNETYHQTTDALLSESDVDKELITSDSITDAQFVFQDVVVEWIENNFDFDQPDTPMLGEATRRHIAP